MNGYPPDSTTTTASAPTPQRVGYRLPLAEPRWTYVLLGINVLVFLAMTAFGYVRGLGLNGSEDLRVLLLFGAQQNTLVAQGDYWRLFTSMFLHIGLLHLAFNAYALYILGKDVEGLYGGARFLAIYLLSGLGGSLATYALAGLGSGIVGTFLFGVSGVSAGASGAIFGLIGAEIAFFRVHQELFGQRGQAQLRSLLMIAAVNLVLGFTIPGINNLAHLGGLAFGLGLGWVLAPDYGFPSPETVRMGDPPTMVDRNSLGRHLPALAVAVAVMLAMGVLGNLRW